MGEQPNSGARHLRRFEVSRRGALGRAAQFASTASRGGETSRFSLDHAKDNARSQLRRAGVEYQRAEILRGAGMARRDLASVPISWRPALHVPSVASTTGESDESLRREVQLARSVRVPRFLLN